MVGDFMVYSFFGHRDVNASLQCDLYNYLEKLAKYDDHYFLVGNEGAFDHYVQSTLKKLKKSYPNIKYSIVLAYLPKPDDIQIENSLYPEGLENIPLRFAIVNRNKWMIDHSDAVIYFQERTWGGVASAIEYAIKKEKFLIHLNNISNL